MCVGFMKLQCVGIYDEFMQQVVLWNKSCALSLSLSPQSTAVGVECNFSLTCDSLLPPQTLGIPLIAI